MKISNGKLNFLLFVFCIFIVVGINQCDAGKDKDKHKQKSKHESTNHRNATHHHHNATAHHAQNHTAPLNIADNSANPANNPPPLGWSLHNNPNQPHPAPNPNGYSLQHHSPSHPDQSNPTPQQPHPIPQQPHPSQTQPAPSQDSGPSALGAGIGGLALGALGGAAGGYFLSNALNSNEKSDEAPTSVVTEIVTETMLSSLPSSVAQDLSSTVVESSTELPLVESSATNGVETTSQISISTTENIMSDIVPLEVIKSEQKLADNQATPQETPKDKSSAVINNLSLITFLITFTSSFLSVV